ncbi:MAG: stage 0 sporulation protein [Clostridia bacterium]|nr:stage 0 sporulation protein [Clostridia bacterium]
MQVGLIFNGNPKILYYTTGQQFDLRTSLVVNTARGLEVGTVVKYKDGEAPEALDFVRVATNEDLQKAKENVEKAKSLIPMVKEEIKKFRLDMKLCLIEYTLDNEKVIINYTAENRVDFREIVKSLAVKMKARIEMHQIGSRDQVQSMGAIGICGRVCCCKAHLSDFDKVTIKMAKNQGLSLNPTKLNGMCGKLLCCLKYEDDVYAETLSRMPKVGQRVGTADGEGEVKSVDVLHEQVEVIFNRGDETERKMYPLDEVKFSKIRREDD